MEGAEECRVGILCAAEEWGIAEDLGRYESTIDVVVCQDTMTGGLEAIQLIEINPSKAMRRCGSCLSIGHQISKEGQTALEDSVGPAWVESRESAYEFQNAYF